MTLIQELQKLSLLHRQCENVKHDFCMLRSCETCRNDRANISFAINNAIEAIKKLQTIHDINLNSEE